MTDRAHPSPAPADQAPNVEGEPMKPSDVLRKARELITPEGAWGQHWFAFDARGKTTNEYASDAVCFCSAGAVRKVVEPRIGHVADWQKAMPALLFLNRIVGQDPANWNDAPKRTQAEVLDAFDCAVALALSEGR